MIEDLPVTVALPAPLHAAVTAWVEHDLGWQAVEADGPLPPVLALAIEPCGDLPWIAFTEGPPAGSEVRRHLTAGAVDVVAWPQERTRLPLLAARISAQRGVRANASRLIVSGTAGGVGTSTVALAIGGLLAWSGARALVVGDSGLATLAGVDPGVEQGSPGVGTGVAIAVAGVPGLSVVRRDDDEAAAGWSGDVVIVDAGARFPSDTTLLVSRADGGLRRARVVQLPVVIVGAQPLAARDAQRLLGRPALVYLPLSARVARAGLQGRVPASLPGSWLATLRAGLARLEQWSR